MVTLSTERLLLRKARTTDVHDLHAIFVEPAAMRFWSRPPHTELAQTESWLGSMIEGGDADFILECEGRAIGKAGFHRPPECGFILHPTYWGRGLAREALTAVLDHVFTIGLVEVAQADVHPRNTPCLGLLQRLGFEEHGRAARTWCVAGEWTDSVYLSLPRDRWETLRTANR